MGQVAATFALSAFSLGLNAYSNRKQRKLAARQNLQSAIEGVELSASDSPALVHYGRTSVEAVPVYLAIGSTVNDRTVSGTRISGDITEFGDGRTNQYFLVQYVIGFGGVYRVLDVLINDRDAGEDVIANSHWLGWRNGGAEQLATHFADENEQPDLNGRDGNSRFTGWSYCTGIFKIDVKRPQYHSLPRVRVSLLGRQAKQIGANGLGARRYSTNPLEVLVDYLVNQEYGTTGITALDFNWSKWNEISLRANEVVIGPNDASFTASTPPPEFSNIVGGAQGTYATYYRHIGVGTDFGISHRGANDNRNITRYSLSGSLNTTQDYPSIIEQILSTVPGLLLFASDENGRYDVSLPRTDMTAEEQSVMEVNDSILSEQGVEALDPDSNDKLNQLTARFVDEALDWRTNTVTFPTPGSAIDTSWLAQDNGVRLTDDIDLHLTKNRYSAESICANIVLLSRRTVYRFSTRPTGWLLELGDVVRLKSDAHGIDSFVRIEDKQIDLLIGRIEFVGREFDPVDFAWMPITPATVMGVPADAGLNVPTVQNVALAENIEDPTKRKLRISFNSLPEAQRTPELLEYVVELEHLQEE